ncbi:MAG: integration host factor subunit beta [Desulfobacteraceae bacterium]|nr:integration host factor subunit beta [Desulfobacteraceae bacterium]
MLKGELIERICGEIDGLGKKDASQAVDLLLATIAEGLTAGRRIEIRGFGSLGVRRRRPKVAKNPKTGAMMDIPARTSVHFTMSKSLKQPLIKKR